MKVRSVSALFLMIAMMLLGEVRVPSNAEAIASMGPNMLEIVRSPGINGNVQANVTLAVLVRAIYSSILSLPAEPDQKICPQYVTAEYKLTFLHGGSSVLHANVQQGGCKTVLLGQEDVRTATPAFWSLLGRTYVLANVQVATDAPGGLGPNDLQNAYALPSATAGKGQTIAIVDAYDDPNAESDMDIYRSTFNLPACTTKNGCFRKVNQRGTTSYPRPDAIWTNEIALDLDMVSAICPNCHIMLVEADSSAFKDLGISVSMAVLLGATVVSNSYGGHEKFVNGSRENLVDATTMAPYYNYPGVPIIASAGDSAYGAQFPAAFLGVTAVGGTKLSRAANARGWVEIAWDATGSGCSHFISKPAWQKDSQCKHKTVADVSAVADPDTGVAVYNTYETDGGDWAPVGGTSASAPIIAGVYALAGNSAQINGAYLYAHTAGFNDITDGSNGTCTPSYLCTAGKGYDGPTGLGTPNGISAF